MDKDIFFMEEAYQQALIAFEKNEIPIGAVIVSNDKIIGRGYNLCESQNDATKHAEMIAIINASKNKNTWRLEDETLYVTLEPCIMCLGAIINCRLNRVVYAVEDAKRKSTCYSTFDILNSNKFNHVPKIKSGVLEFKCYSLIRSFFKNLRCYNR